MEKFRYLAKEKTEKIPKVTGVYVLSSPKEMLYIGKATNLRDRMKNHFQQPTYRDDLFIDQVTKIGYIETNSEIEALLLESQLIKYRSPKYNVMWKDDKNYFYVAITPSTPLRAGKDELPRVFITHQPNLVSSSLYLVSGIEKKKIQNTRYKIRDTKYVGPFVDGNAIKRTLRTLRKIFPYYTTKKHTERPCQYCHLGLCPGPNPDKKEYNKNIKNLTAVLKGKRTSVLKKFQREMKLASKNQEYEKAGSLRDQIQDLEIIFFHAKVLRPEEEKTPIHWKNTETYLQKILGTSKPISRVEAYDISNIQGTEATGSMPVFIDGKPAKEHYKKFKVHISGKPNDFAMLHEVLSRRLKHKEWGYPDLMIIDGGKGQLSAALKALDQYKIPASPKTASRGGQDTPVPKQSSVRGTAKYPSTPLRADKIHVAAIAKKHNELFLPGLAKPLLLKDMPQDVSNLILYIRDEAHRFAINYHRKLRKKELLKQ